MKKIRFYFDKDKEENWLNQMSRKGWAMSRFFCGVYTFEPCEPGKYIYRVDMPQEIGKDNMRGESRAQYISFIEETEAEHVCDWFWWSIFRREASKGKFELYTDSQSRIVLYQRIRKLFLWVGMLDVICTLNNTLIFIRNNAKEWIDILLLGIMYSIVMVFIIAIVKTSRKISKLRQKSLLTK